MSREREKIPVRRGEPARALKEMTLVIDDHAYLSAGDTHAASGDRAYRGCFLCGRSRREHAA